MVNYLSLIPFVVLIAFGGYFYYRYKKQESPTEEEPTTVQELLGISDISNGVISVGNRHCKILAVGSINYHLMSEHEQDLVDSIFASLLASLNFPIQIYVQTRLLDLSGAIEELNRDIQKAPENLKPYGQKLKDYLQEWIRVRSVMLRNPYVVIICDNDNATEARRELEHRQQLVIEGLSRCGLPTRPLDDNEIAELFYAIYNSKTRALIAPLKNTNSPLYVRRKEDGLVSA